MLVRREIGWAIRRVLRDPERRRFFFHDPALARALLRFLFIVAPAAFMHVRFLRRRAMAIPNERLRTLALQTLELKGYHAVGACVLATYLPRRARSQYIDVVVPLETIYDYLDTLCDRDGNISDAASDALHLALQDALSPNAIPMREYYALAPASNDGGFLDGLVAQVRTALSRIPYREELQPLFGRAVELYAVMQSAKHALAPARVEQLHGLLQQASASERSDLLWWEFAAACGSQFHVYGPLFAALSDDASAIAATFSAYFPDACAAHVLLDDFIDQREDGRFGEFNFVREYENDAFDSRLALMVHRAFERFATVQNGEAHRFAVRTMLLFYLTHPKVFEQNLDATARSILERVDRSPIDREVRPERP